MKNTKQLLIAAAVASMSLNAMADITISGEAKVNAKGGDYSIESDLTITGKSGDTSVVAQIGLDNSNEVEQLYMKSKVAGIKVKAGRWKSGKGELGKNGGNTVNRVQASTSFGGVKLVYQDKDGNAGTWIAVAGTIGGVKVEHKLKDTKTETKASGSMGGVNFSAHIKDYDSGDIDASITLKTSVQGIDLTYVNTTSDAGTMMDGFIGKRTGVTEANAFGISTTIAGNKVTYKGIVTDGTDNKKLIITRKIASGSTFEATYDDNAESLDLELAVKF